MRPEAAESPGGRNEAPTFGASSAAHMLSPHCDGRPR